MQYSWKQDVLQYIILLFFFSKMFKNVFHNVILFCWVFT